MGGQLDDFQGETQCALHAYVLMTNHVHLLLTPKKAELVPRLIMSLSRRYVQPRNLSWTGVSVRFCGFLARRDDDADCTLLGEATLPESRKSVQSRP